MRAMTLRAPGPAESEPLALAQVPVPEPGPGEVLLRVVVCGVCRTDLHVVEGVLPVHRPRIVPGHEVVAVVEQCGPGAERFSPGDLVGAAWLHRSCGQCAHCARGSENLCLSPLFTGWDRNGGYADYMTAPQDYVYALPRNVPPRDLAPLLCAGIIGYRALVRSGVRPGEPLGLYGFGGSAHIVIQVARHWGCPVYVCTRGERHRALARELGAAWTGAATDTPPAALRGAILFAPSGDLVPVALRALDRGGTLAIAGIWMTPIPQMDYLECLFQERAVCSVTANTREDGRALLRLAGEIPLRTTTVEYPLEQAGRALVDLKRDRINGAAVLRVSPDPP